MTLDLPVLANTPRLLAVCSPRSNPPLEELPRNIWLLPLRRVWHLGFWFEGDSAPYLSPSCARAGGVRGAKIQ